MKKINPKIKKYILPVFICFLTLGILLTSGAFLMSGAMASSQKDRIHSESEARKIYGVDCIIVLGAKVKSDGTPSDMLKDRLDVAIALYKAGVSDRLLMSGDHGSVGYNEVGNMKKYAVEAGVPEEAIFMDHAGFSTFETMYRARDVFLTESYYKKVIVVTQEYHLSRALYIADTLGLDAYGVPADLHTYRGQWKRDLREVLARCKDFFYCFYGAEPKYLGEPISIFGDGNTTNDDYYNGLWSDNK